MKYKRLFKREQSTVFTRSYEKLSEKGKHHIRRRPYLLPIAGFLLGAAIVAGIVFAHGGRTTGPSASHVVYLFDNNTDKIETLDTKASTVGALIKDLPLNLIPQDVVEPSLNTPIVEDNFRVNVYRARPVTVLNDDGSKIVAVTAQKSPRVVAQAAGITIYPEDNIRFEQGTLKENIIGEKVVIERATPVYLNLYGTALTIRTHSKTVGDLLKEKGIKLAQGDTLQPAAQTTLTPNTQVFVERMGVQIVSVNQTIAVPVQYVNDSTLTRGTTAIRQAGSAGSEVVTYQVQTKNGAEISRQAIQTVITVQAVPRIVAIGSQAFSGSLADWLLKLRTCESGGNYQDNTGNGYYGAYQFSLSTWQRLGYSGLPSDAPPGVQDQAIITNTVRSSGGLATQNPGCYRKEGLSAFPPSNS